MNTEHTTDDRPEAASGPGTATGHREQQQGKREAMLALFSAHAAARIRRDSAESARLADQMGPELRMHHVLWVLTLLGQAVVEDLGDTPDPCDLAELTRRLHEKHYAEDRNFQAIRSEAMVRAVCGEGHLLTEIPFAEQPGYAWAAIGELIPPDETDAQLARRFAAAEEFRDLMVGAVLASPLYQPAPESEPASESEPSSEPESESAPTEEAAA